MASTVLALLEEPDYALKEYALATLDAQVNEMWPDISDSIPLIEELHEDAHFPARGLAALVVAKVYYNLGDLQLALKYALAADHRLDLSQKSEFVDTMISVGIKTYVEERQKLVDAAEDAAVDAVDSGVDTAGDSSLSEPKEVRTVGENSGNSGNSGFTTEELLSADSRLISLVETMIERCFLSGHTRLALGIAMESRRLDLVEKYLCNTKDSKNANFVYETAMALIGNRRFRDQLLHLLTKLLLPAMQTEQDFKEFYSLLTKIAIQLNDCELAYDFLLRCRPEALGLQVAFDFVESASQELREKTALRFLESSKLHHSRIVRVLSGIPSCDYRVTFLSKNCHTDSNILQRTKTQLDSRNSMFHAALSFQNALLHLGTTHDQFFRSNIDWLGRASHWTKFTASAALGVIHLGNLTQGLRVLQPYLAKTDKASAYVRGGALYGLGMVFAGFGKEVLELLENQITLSQMEDGFDLDDEVVVHGACLGIALAGMCTQSEQLYTKLRDELYVDSAVAGEAVGIAMGFVMLGSQNKTAEVEMLQYARDTQHEKIVRSLAVGLALLNYGREEAAEPLVTKLLAEHEPILRYGGCFTLALAYAGTGNNNATKRLLHAAVSDASDDVRRAAVLALGFVYIRNMTALPRMLLLLSESHNPHVRYGTALALGIACAGTGHLPAVDVLEPMLKDNVDFVRQGSMIALAMILVQHTELSHPRVKAVREQLAKVVKTKNEDALAKFGAVLTQGLLDAGGCNATISLENKQTGNLNTRGIAGLTVFLQYWYWFPFAHFVGLAYTPTTVACVQPDLRMPQLELECSGAPAKRFNYPAKLEEPNTKAPEQHLPAVLSTTFKEKQRKHTSSSKEKEKEKEEKAKELKEKEENEKEKKRALDAANRENFDVQNLGRVVPWQRKFLKLPKDSRFCLVDPARELNSVVIISYREDVDQSKEVTFITTQRQAQSIEDEQSEAPLPRPFTLTVSDDESPVH